MGGEDQKQCHGANPPGCRWSRPWNRNDGIFWRLWAKGLQAYSSGPTAEPPAAIRHLPHAMGACSWTTRRLLALRCRRVTDPLRVSAWVSLHRRPSLILLSIPALIMDRCIVVPGTDRSCLLRCAEVRCLCQLQTTSRARRDCRSATTILQPPLRLLHLLPLVGHWTARTGSDLYT